MKKPPVAFCQSVELATELRYWAEIAGQPIDARLGIEAVFNRKAGQVPFAVVFQQAPQAAELVALREVIEPHEPCVLLFTVPSNARRLASDLGFVTVDKLGALVAALAILALATNTRSALTSFRRVSLRLLGESDRARMAHVIDKDGARHGFFVRHDANMIAWRRSANTQGMNLAPFEWLLDALVAIGEVAPYDTATPLQAHAHGIEQLWHNTLYGPARRLSDATTQKLLAALGLSVCHDALSQSMSQINKRAQALGFPVKLALHLTETRLSEHPELELNDIHHPNALKHGFTQLFDYAERFFANERVLGVSVSRAHAYKARLWLKGVLVRASALAQAHSTNTVLFELGFYTFSGQRAHETAILTHTMSPIALARALWRLQVFTHVYEAGDTGFAALIGRLSTMIASLSQALVCHSPYLEAIEVGGLGLLVDDTLEIYAANATVSDAFVRLLTHNTETGEAALQNA